MAELHFEWDLRKSASNARKHKVTFEEARSAFADPHGLVIDDPDHSQDEDPSFSWASATACAFLWSATPSVGTSFGSFPHAKPLPAKPPPIEGTCDDAQRV